jgi:hypothetical protein
LEKRGFSAARRIVVVHATRKMVTTSHLSPTKNLGEDSF